MNAWVHFWHFKDEHMHLLYGMRIPALPTKLLKLHADTYTKFIPVLESEKMVCCHKIYYRHPRLS